MRFRGLCCLSSGTIFKMPLEELFNVAMTSLAGQLVMILEEKKNIQIVRMTLFIYLKIFLKSKYFFLMTLLTLAVMEVEMFYTLPLQFRLLSLCEEMLLKNVITISFIWNDQQTFRDKLWKIISSEIYLVSIFEISCAGIN